jgi:hypothetical protein
MDLSKKDSETIINDNTLLNNHIKDKMNIKVNLPNINKNNNINATSNIKYKESFLKEHEKYNIKNGENPLISKEIKTTKKHLFPYKYYLCSIFIKSAYTSSKPYFFTTKFIMVYNYICHLFDISSYLLLQKEFHLLKNDLQGNKFENIKKIKSGNNLNINYKMLE